MSKEAEAIEAARRRYKAALDTPEEHRRYLELMRVVEAVKQGRPL